MRVNATTTDLQMTVPANVKSGLLILCGSYWNKGMVAFEDPTGSGVGSAEKLHDDYSNSTANIHLVVYKITLNPGGSITVSSGSNDQYVGKSMVLLY